jgi:RNA polymerase sigma factor for flagellar operon FliA
MTDKREETTLKYAPLVKIIAHRLAMRLPSHIEVEELINVGIAGLLEAIDRFDPSKGVKMETFLTFRVRGAMLDELRKMDWIPRSVRQKARQLEEEIAECEAKLGRKPDDEDMAEFLGVEIEEYHRMLTEARGAAVFSLEDLGFARHNDDERDIMECIADPNGEDPLQSLNVKQFQKMLASAIDTLKDKERMVLTLYYYEDLNLKEIGRVIGVSESRVCQLHTQAILKLKGRLKSLGR